MDLVQLTWNPPPPLPPLKMDYVFFLTIVLLFFSNFFLIIFTLKVKKTPEKWTRPKTPPPPPLCTKSIQMFLFCFLLNFPNPLYFLQRNSFERYFNFVLLLGCLFHLGQAVWRKVVWSPNIPSNNPPTPTRWETLASPLPTARRTRSGSWSGTCCQWHMSPSPQHDQAEQIIQHQVDSFTDEVCNPSLSTSSSSLSTSLSSSSLSL